MELYHDTAQDSKGNIINGATVTVTVHSSGAPADIYDKDGNSLANPFLSGYDRSNGEIDFAAEDGLYDIQIVSGSTVTLKAIGLFDSDATRLAVGNINTPVIDLSKGVYDGTLTFTNATPSGSRTYIDRVGILQFADTDELRREARGYLIEDSSTNIITDSSDLSAWTTVGSATVTTDGTTFPDESNSTAYKVTGTGSPADYVRKDSTVTDTGQPISHSIFVRAGDISNVRLRLTAIGGTTLDVSAVYDMSTEQFSAITASRYFELEKLTDGWYRIGVSEEMNNSGNTTIQIRISAESAGYFYALGGQIEDGKKRPTSYIPTTTAAVTRQADYLRLNPAAHPSIMAGNPFSFSVDFSVLYSGTESDNRHILSLGTNEAGTIGVSRLQIPSSTTNTEYLRSAAANALSTSLDTDTHRVTITVSEDELVTGYYDGEQIFSSTESLNVATGSPPTVVIGAEFGGISQLNGHIKDFRAWPIELTSTEARMA